MQKKLLSKKFTISAFLMLLSVAGCKKEISSSPENPLEESGPVKQVRSPGDTKFDVLGYGLDVTGDMINPQSLSDVSIFDMTRFEAEQANKIEISTTGSGSQLFYGGATAFEYVKDVTEKKAFDLSVTSRPKIEGAEKDTSTKLFTGSFSKNNSDQNKTGFSSAYSYATYEVNKIVKRIRFNGDANIALLSNYLTPEFLNNVANYSAEELVARYGTHVMLDVSIGGRLRFDYSGSVLSQSSYSQRTESVKMGLGVALLKIIGVNINHDKSTAEVNQATTNTTRRQYTAKYYGGTNSGVSVTIDKDGNTSQTINLANWEQSVTAANAALVDADNAVYLYHFIADPTKKAAVKAAIEKHISDNQIVLVPDYTHELVNVNSFSAKSGGHHYLSTGLVNDWNYWNFIGVEFRAYPRQVPGSVPVNVFFSQQGKDHLYTTGVVNDFSWWRSEGVAFYAYSTQLDGTIPVYVHTSRDGQDHYYSSSSITFDPGYWSPSVSVAFYAYPFGN